MTLGEVQDLLRSLRRVKQFYNRQIATVSTSIREHEKIEKQLRDDQFWNSTDEEDAAESQEEATETNDRNSKRQKINEKIKIKVKKRI